jgi:hypothetical protein
MRTVMGCEDVVPELTGRPGPTVLVRLLTTSGQGTEVQHAAPMHGVWNACRRHWPPRLFQGCGGIGVDPEPDRRVRSWGPGGAR